MPASSTPHAIVIDDHTGTREALAALVAREGFTVTEGDSLKGARRALREQPPDVILLDLNLPDGTGMSVLDDLESVRGPAVILVTGHASLQTAVEALRRGVTDYLTKPVDTTRLKAILADVARTGGLAAEITQWHRQIEESGRFGRLVGASPAMQQIYNLVSRVAPSSATVIITGDSGTGKEVVARTIHDLSRRRHGPFEAVNCGAITPTLMESELFGHERGSFTGADRRHKGVFERASRGTLFLDEITEMPAELQVKLLRVLESGTFTRVGGEQTIEVDVRVLAATNRKVEEAVAKGRLRDDLYYRLKVFQINLPSLRDRLDDVELLAGFFLDEVERTEGRRKPVTAEALDVLRNYSWPGNVRELRNVVHSSYILANEVIDVDALPAEVRRLGPDAGFDGSSVTVPVGAPMSEVERRLILATLNHYQGNKTKTADVLGISLKTLYNRLNSYQGRSSSGSSDPSAA